MSGEAILIVDDNAMNLKVGELVLGAQGYAVQTARNAREALAAVAQSHPDVILMDIQLPGIDGLELTRRLKADVSNRDIAVVAVTAHTRADTEDRARAARCVGWMTRPIDTRALAELIASHVSRSGPEQDLPGPESASRLQTLLKRHGPDVVRQTLLLFDETARECLSALRLAATRHDMPGFGSAAHKLAGSCNILGADAAGNRCRDLETLARAGELTRAVALIDDLEQDVDRARTAMVEALTTA